MNLFYLCLSCNTYYPRHLKGLTGICENCHEMYSSSEEVRRAAEIKTIRALVAAQEAKVAENKRLAFSCIMGFEVPAAVWEWVQRESPNMLDAAQDPSRLTNSYAVEYLQKRIKREMAQIAAAKERKWKDTLQIHGYAFTAWMMEDEGFSLSEITRILSVSADPLKHTGFTHLFRKLMEKCDMTVEDLKTCGTGCDAWVYANYGWDRAATREYVNSFTIKPKEKTMCEEGWVEFMRIPEEGQRVEVEMVDGEVLKRTYCDGEFRKDDQLCRILNEKRIKRWRAIPLQKEPIKLSRANAQDCIVPAVRKSKDFIPDDKRDINIERFGVWYTGYYYDFDKSFRLRNTPSGVFPTFSDEFASCRWAELPC